MPRVSTPVKSWSHRSSLTARTRDKHAQARDAIYDLRLEIESRLDTLADSLGMKREILHGYFYGLGIKRKHEGVSVWNAARHSVACEWRDQGRKFRAIGDADFDAAVASRVIEYNSDDIRLAQAREAVIIARERSANQVRLPGQSRLVDTNHMQDLLRDQARDFNTRTGGHMCGFIFRGHPDDYAAPEYFGSAICREWFEQVLGLPITDLGLELESWALSGGARQAAEKTQSRANVFKHEIRVMLDARLKRATKGERTTMAYKAFAREIEDKYKITLHGWPLPALVNPSDIRNVPQLSQVHDALKAGKCFFRKMTGAELEQRAIQRRQEELDTVPAIPQVVSSPQVPPPAPMPSARSLPASRSSTQEGEPYDTSRGSMAVDLTGSRPNVQLSQPMQGARSKKRKRLDPNPALSGNMSLQPLVAPHGQEAQQALVPAQEGRPALADISNMSWNSLLGTTLGYTDTRVGVPWEAS